MILGEKDMDNLQCNLGPSYTPFEIFLAHMQQFSDSSLQSTSPPPGTPLLRPLLQEKMPGQERRSARAKAPASLAAGSIP